MHQYSRHQDWKKAPATNLPIPPNPPMTPQSDINDWRLCFTYHAAELKKLIEIADRAHRDRAKSNPASSPFSPFLCGTSTRRIQRAVAHQVNEVAQLWNKVRTVERMKKKVDAEATAKASSTTGAAPSPSSTPTPSAPPDTTMLEASSMLEILTVLSHVIPPNTAVPNGAAPTLPVELLHNRGAQQDEPTDNEPLSEQTTPLGSAPSGSTATPPASPATASASTAGASKSNNARPWVLDVELSQNLSVDYSPYFKDWASLFTLLPFLPSMIHDVRRSLIAYLAKAKHHMISLKYIESKVINNLDPTQTNRSTSHSSHPKADTNLSSTSTSTSSPVGITIGDSDYPTVMNFLHTTQGLGANLRKAPQRPFVTESGAIPQRPIVFYGLTYSQICHLTIRIASRLHDIDLATHAMGLQRELSHILLKQDQRLQYAIDHWDESASLDSVESGSHLLPHSPIPRDGLRRLIFDATRQKHLFRQCLFSYIRMIQADCIQPPHAPQLAPLDSALAIIGGHTHPHLLWSCRELYNAWFDIKRFSLPLEVRHYCIYATTVSALQFEIAREHDSHRAKAILKRLHPLYRLSTPYAKVLERKNRDQSHLIPYPLNDQAIPVVDSSTLPHQRHENWQLQVMQAFPRRSVSLDQWPSETARVEHIRSNALQRRIDQLTEKVSLLKTRLEQQLNHRVNTPPKTNAFIDIDAEQIVQEMTILLHPERAPYVNTEAPLSGPKVPMPRLYDNTDADFQADDDEDIDGEHDADSVSSDVGKDALAEYRAIASSSGIIRSQRTWELPDEAQSSRKILRFLKSYFLACMRAGDLTLTLECLQLYIQCNLLPPLRFMQHALNVLSDALTECKLEPSLRNGMKDVVPDHARLKELLKWVNMIQVYWPLQNDVYSFLLTTWSQLSTFSARALRYHDIMESIESADLDARELKKMSPGAEKIAYIDLPPKPDMSPELLKEPWTKKELESMLNLATTAMNDLIDIGYSSPFFYRAEYYVEPSLRAESWHIRGVMETMAQLKKHEASLSTEYREDATQSREKASDAISTSVIIPELDGAPKPSDAKPSNSSKSLFPATGVPMSTVISSASIDPPIDSILMNKCPPMTLLHTVAQCRAWLAKFHNQAPGWHYSGWIDRTHRILQYALQDVLLARYDAIHLYQLVERYLSQRITLSPAVLNHTIDCLRNEWKTAAAQEEGLDIPHTETEQLTIAVARLQLTMFELGYQVHMSHLEWVTKKLARIPSFAAQFYLHAIRHRLRTDNITPTAGIFHAFLLAETQKFVLREAVALRPQHTAQPPQVSLNFDVNDPMGANTIATTNGVEDVWTSDNDMSLFAQTGVPANPTTFGSHPHLQLYSHSTALSYGKRPSNYMESVLQGVMRQWNQALEGAGLVPTVTEATNNGASSNGSSTGPSFAQDPSTPSNTFPMAGLGYSSLVPAALPSLSTSSTLPSPSTSKNIRGSPFFNWLHSILTFNLESVISTLDWMKLQGVPPTLQTYRLALESCVQSIEGKSSSLVLSKGGNLLAALTNHSYTSQQYLSPAAIQKAVHYGMLIRADLDNAGLRPDITVANQLLKLLLKSGKHLLAQEMFGESPSKTIGFTFLANGTGRWVTKPSQKDRPNDPDFALLDEEEEEQMKDFLDLDEDEEATQSSTTKWNATGDNAKDRYNKQQLHNRLNSKKPWRSPSSSSPSQAPVQSDDLILDVPISLDAEIRLLENALVTMQDSPPSYAIGRCDTLEEWTDQKALQALNHFRKARFTPLPFYVRPDKQTLAILDTYSVAMSTPSPSTSTASPSTSLPSSISSSSLQFSSDIPPLIRSFHLLLQRRCALEKEVRSRELEWDEDRLNQLEDLATQQPDLRRPPKHLRWSRTWKKQHPHACRMYLQGRCYRGSSCEFPHVPEGIPQTVPHEWTRSPEAQQRRAVRRQISREDGKLRKQERNKQIQEKKNYRRDWRYDNKDVINSVFEQQYNQDNHKKSTQPESNQQQESTPTPTQQQHSE